MSGNTGRRLAAVALTAFALVAAVGCSSSDSDPEAASTASKGPRDYSTTPGKGGPCRATMTHIDDVGQKITTDAEDRTKAQTDLKDAADQFADDAEKIKNPEAKKAAEQLSTVYRGLADSAKHNRSPDMKTLPDQVQSAISALSTCAAAE
ncbi:hypothetical protein OG548_31355 [Streptomyces sp. NBC_01356]|uniref:hypothetical protein n=1 Tax=Streptomyces sp. NBC_01356 TaxID=2903836 RepID=UPI002E2FAD1B|nr:hypothetical protein [Streptomyces sp. NBC_01356]